MLEEAESGELRYFRRSSCRKEQETDENSRIIQSEVSLMKDPFKAAYEEQESLPESVIPSEEEMVTAEAGEEEIYDHVDQDEVFVVAAAPSAPFTIPTGKGSLFRAKEEEEEEEEKENTGVDLRKVTAGDPDKLTNM